MATLSRKHYIQIANILKKELNRYDTPLTERESCAVENVAIELAEYFENENPHFDHSKFMEAVRGRT